MKEIIAKMICVVLTAPLIPVVLIGYIPYALFRGVTSESVFDAYFDILERFVDFLLYPYYKYLERKKLYKKVEAEGGLLSRGEC